MSNPLQSTPGPRSAVLEIAARHGLEERFPADVVAESDRWVAAPDIADPTLIDRTAIPFVTIDNADSRDLDQAVHVAPEPEGGFLVSYALADASYYVAPGSALFREALRRGASYYLPGLCIPMLPRPLSEGVVSLNPDVDRRALLFRMWVDANGRCVRTDLERARVRSRAKLSYDGVQAYYDAPRQGPLAGAAFSDSLDALQAVGRLRIADAARRHVVRYNRRSLEVRVDGVRFVAVGDVRNDTERYNEQISLLCNSEGARLLAAARRDHVQPVFRVHPSPSPGRLDALVHTIDALVAAHGRDPARWRWDGAEPLSEYLGRIPDATAEERRLGAAVQRQALICNHRSTFQEEPGLHHGVGAPCYSRFSSPMRELVGVFTHKEAFELLSGPSASADDTADERLRAEVVETANRAKELQRAVTRDGNKLVIDALLGEDLDLPEHARPIHPGTLLGVVPTRLYVQLDEPPLELKLYRRHVEKAWGTRLELDEHGVVLREGGRDEPVLRTGDAIGVRVAGYDELADRWRLVPVRADVG